MTLIGNTIRNGAICATAAWAGNAIKGAISLEELKDVELEQLPKMATDYVQSILAKVTRENAAYVGYGSLEFVKSAVRSFIHFKPEGPTESIAASLSEHKLALAAGATFGVAATVINSLLARVPQLKDQRVARFAASAAVTGAAIYVATQQLPFATDPALVEKIAARVGILACGSFLIAKIVGTCMRADVKATKIEKAAADNGEIVELKRRLGELEKKKAPEPVVDKQTIYTILQRLEKLEKKEAPKVEFTEETKKLIEDLRINVGNLQNDAKAYVSVKSDLAALTDKIGKMEERLGRIQSEVGILGQNDISGDLGEEGRQSTPTGTPQKNNVKQKVIQLQDLGNK